MQRLTSREMAVGAMIAALYFALGIAFAPISFGPVQVRVAEALAMLCVFSPVAIVGVTLGCVLTNAYGFVSGVPGATMLGPLDILLGSSATLVAGYLSWKLRGFKVFSLPVFSVLPPVLVNALVIGGELSFAITGSILSSAHLLFGAEVGLGQVLACGGLGLLLVRTLEKTGIATYVFCHMPPAGLPASENVH